MDTGYIGLLILCYTILFIIYQRTESNRKRLSRYLIILITFLLVIRGNLLPETIIGFLGGTFIAALFWVLIGRYNPVGSSDDIKVYGLDD